MPPQRKQHWYCMVFLVPSGDRHSTYIGFDKKRIACTDIESTKAILDIDSRSVMTNCSHLGYMTRAEFTGE